MTSPSMRGTRMKMKIGLFFLLTAGLAGTAAAQEELVPKSRYGMFHAGAGLQTWSKGDGESMTQTAFPMALVLPLSNRFQLTIVHTPGLSWRNIQEFVQKLHGLSDTWIQGAAVLMDERLLLNFGMGIPTGKTRLTNDEYSVSRSWLSRNIFKFNVPTYGQGFCGRLGMAMALPLAKRLVLGFGGQYLYRTPYHPAFITYTVADEIRVSDKEFQPGDELNAHAGLEFGIGGNFKCTLDAVYSHYYRDMQEGVEVYGPGDRLTGHLGVFYRFSQNYYVWSRLVYRQQGKNEVLQGLTMQDEPRNTNGDQLEFSFTAKIVHFQRGELLFMLDSRFEDANDAGKRADLIVGGGIGAIYRIWEGIHLDFQFKYYDGYYHLWNETFDRVTAHGFELYSGFRIEL